ncbi:casein kinase II beta 1 subunit [Ascosphaera apis ARSEF 7405]|uniref:Casein kinase II subunit beta n=1 Tax=Ascosphaera apis ARSEF 7405 TaxID=392613 RepID=A0A167V134_9EURO|nr:casein kinase II beta 1 subunit [Ascosphaera apis ARSEF 7405]
MSGSEEIPDTWIASYCSLMGHEFFAEVSEDFIEDDFNLTGLQSQVPLFKEALELILDVEPDDEDDVEDDEDDDEDDGRPEDYRPRRHQRVASDMSLVETSAELLYGLIHQRYITSRAGLQQMLDKYELAHFGLCPRVHCNGCRVLPVGLSDVPGVDTVKLFCPSCLDVYTPPNSRFQSVDGCYFGTTFCYLFFMTFPELDVGAPFNDPSMSQQQQLNRSNLSNSRNQQNQQQQRDNLVINGVLAKNIAPGLGQKRIYEPKIYGFKVSERSEVGPRMKWLRMKPADITELDEERKHAEGRGDRDANEDVEMPSATTSPISERRKRAPVSRRHQMSAQSGAHDLG